jgi:hypothetical protein
MQEIDQLRALHLRLLDGLDAWELCVEWAVKRMQLDQEGDDLDIVFLSGVRGNGEALTLVKNIVHRYLSQDSLDPQVAAGKYIVDLRARYQKKQVEITTLEPKFWRLFASLDHPVWLSMLARNCEYAIDIPAFVEPFEAEFDYIASLWEFCHTLKEFQAVYRSEVSMQHDVS